MREVGETVMSSIKSVLPRPSTRKASAGSRGRRSGRSTLGSRSYRAA
jgi:hypothetical protein